MVSKKFMFLAATSLVAGLFIGNLSFASTNIIWKHLLDRPIHKVVQLQNETIIDFDTTDIERKSETETRYIKQKGEIDQNGNSKQLVNEVREYLVGGKTVQLTKLKGKNIVIDEENTTSEPLFLNQNGKSNEVVLVVNQDLYLLNIDSGESKLLSKPHVAGYDKEKLLNYEINEPENAHPDDYARFLAWVANPKISPSGDKIIYESNRRNYEGIFHYDIWLLDIATGEEQIILEDSLIGEWLDKDIFSYKSFDLTDRASAGIFNLSLKEKKSVKVGSGDFVVGKNAAIELTQIGVVFHLWDGHKQEISIPDAVTVYNPTLSKDFKSLAVIYQDGKGNIMIAVFDIANQKIDRIVSPPSQYIGKIYFTQNGKLIVSDPTNEITWTE